MSANPLPVTPPLTKKDFQSDQDVRWCPGCGDYVILAQVQRVLPELGIPRENIVVISGIGCSSRFPYYMNTYGMHSIHGRAPAIATGLKVARPELSVWVATGDGDGLSIGGNHTIHVLRRNVDMKILLFNNRIYGLTKGQYSPTSQVGMKSKSSPYGSLDAPFDPLRLALGAGGTFVARAVDAEPAHLTEVLRRAAHHKGTAFIEIYQNCVVFNDGAFDYMTEKAAREETRLVLTHGKPLVFGKAKDKGIRLNPKLEPEVFQIGREGDISQCLVHDETSQTLAWILAHLQPPKFPTPVGVFRAVSAPTYDAGVHEQEEEVRGKKGAGDLAKLLGSGETWTVS